MRTGSAEPPVAALETWPQDDAPSGGFPWAAAIGHRTPCAAETPRKGSSYSGNLVGFGSVPTQQCAHGLRRAAHAGSTAAAGIESTPLTLTSISDATAQITLPGVCRIRPALAIVYRCLGTPDVRTEIPGGQRGRTTSSVRYVSNLQGANPTKCCSLLNQSVFGVRYSSADACEFRSWRFRTGCLPAGDVCLCARIPQD